MSNAASGDRKTWRDALRESGEVCLATEDPEIMARAERAKDGLVETFVYWTDDGEETVVGSVKDCRKDGKLLRFTVAPEEPGAHAI